MASSDAHPLMLRKAILDEMHPMVVMEEPLKVEASRGQTWASVLHDVHRDFKVFVLTENKERQFVGWHIPLNDPVDPYLSMPWRMCSVMNWRFPEMKLEYGYWKHQQGVPAAPWRPQDECFLNMQPLGHYDGYGQGTEPHLLPRGDVNLMPHLAFFRCGDTWRVCNRFCLQKALRIKAECPMCRSPMHVPAYLGHANQGPCIVGHDAV
jgi:hypothetical protein